MRQFRNTEAMGLYFSESFPTVGTAIIWQWVDLTIMEKCNFTIQRAFAASAITFLRAR